MRSDELRKLIRIVEESEIEEIEIHDYPWGKRVRIAKKVAGAVHPAVIHGGASPSAAPLPSAAAGGAVSEEVDVSNLTPVPAPMVGTFYSAPAPDAEPYVKLGDLVHKGQTVCIVEAMKLMNEIQSESDGRIAKILVENGQPVEYGQPLFLLSPA
ncbi:MAG: acetyl-CoA carboxylase biotin carboxyl carrier protein [Candidatus Eisenbacteria bacterium]|nr:acetyl-CoA carboxylase biotin carboxyl carrier protein [Candidatus Eisenbacteria bacterium]